MDSLKNLFEQTRERYAGMPASTRLLSALLLAVVILSSCWMLSVYDSQAQTELLSNLSPAEAQVATSSLNSVGLKEYKLTANDTCICVPANERAKYEKALREANAMPEASEDRRDIYDGSFFVAPSVHEQKKELASEKTLEGVLMRRQQIGFANVEYSEAESTGFGPKQRSCCIQVESPDKRPIDLFVLATIRETASSYFAGLKTQDVRVVDLNARQSPDVAALNPEDQRLLQAKRAWEEHYRNKIRDLLANYGSVKIFVDVQIDPLIRKRTESRKLIAAPQTLEEVTVERRVEITRPKHRMSIEDAESLGQSSLPVDEVITTTRRQFGHTENVESKHGLNPKSLHLSVELPESHYRKLYQQQLRQNQMPTAELALNIPTPSELAAIQREVEQRVEATLHGLTQLQQDLKVSVQVQSYADQAPPEIQSPSMAQLTGFWLMQRQQTILLVGIALVMLLVMSKWIRNSRHLHLPVGSSVVNTQPPEINATQTPEETEFAASQRESAEPAIQKAAPHLKSSLSKLVTENPENTKAVLNRWLNDAA